MQFGSSKVEIVQRLGAFAAENPGAGRAGGRRKNGPEAPKSAWGDDSWGPTQITDGSPQVRFSGLRIGFSSQMPEPLSPRSISDGH
jgi:hypothetical protein